MERTTDHYTQALRIYRDLVCPKEDKLILRYYAEQYGLEVVTD